MDCRSPISAPYSKDDRTEAGYVSTTALGMMVKMGYKEGARLGKRAKGPVQSIELPLHLGKRGLGLHLPGLEPTNAVWDFKKEKIIVEEKADWLSHKDDMDDIGNFNFTELMSWMITKPTKTTMDDETQFCDPEILKRVLDAKGVFDVLDPIELCRARARANPFESIRSAFFMNRAALKMANIDAATGFIFTDVDRHPCHRKMKGPYYFADVCAGPGGFSEYIMWRKKWLFKGFGFTLRGDHDFKLEESFCASPVTFNAQYGVRDDGNICYPENIEHFSARVLHETEGVGVHFMMSDGGFSVEGNENLQEVLSKQIYICQCLMALEIVRPNGHFVTKVFDLFTTFSAGLVYLMYRCFEKVAILKPNSSRPANSERYLICYGLKNCPEMIEIRKYMREIVKELWKIREEQHNANLDLVEIVPLLIMHNSKTFYNYLIMSNNRIGEQQIVGLSKLTTFCQNPTLVDPRQDALRNESLKYWRIPDKPKSHLPRLTTNDLITTAVLDPEFMFAPPTKVYNIEDLDQHIVDKEDWMMFNLACNSNVNICNFYAAVGGSKVYRLQRNRWVKVNHVQLTRGTILYGEMVKEKVIQRQNINNSECETELEQQSLHVIDALRLGDTSLADLPLNERLDLIETYCEAANHEFRSPHIRLRAKVSYPLSDIGNNVLTHNVREGQYFSALPTLGFDSIKELYPVNSILLLKTTETQSLNSTYPLRIQIFFGIEENHERLQNDFRSSLTFNKLKKFIENKNHVSW